MTKFVAAAFLPMVIGLVFLVFPETAGAPASRMAIVDCRRQQSPWS